MKKLNTNTGNALRIMAMVFLVLFFGQSVFAYVSSSTNYRIQSDSINTGGERQTSTNYIAEDTLGESATGISTSTSFRLKAGYQQMQEVSISLGLTPSAVSMSPSILGLTGGTSNGLATTTITTDSPGGYTLTIQASASPAMATSSYSFTDYTVAGAGVPDYTWSILATTSEFGFTAEGGDIIQKFKDDGIDTCATSTNDTANVCWYNFATTTENIAQSYSSNHPSGTATVIKFRAQSGVSNLQVAGNYRALITITATTN